MTSPQHKLSIWRPSGFNLGPLLFVLYINDLPQCLENCSIPLFYVDDTVMYSMNHCTSEIDRVVKDDLNRVVQWMESTCSRLILNQSKTKINALCMKLHGRILTNHQVFVYSYTDKTLGRLAKFSYSMLRSIRTLQFNIAIALLC